MSHQETASLSTNFENESLKLAVEKHPGCIITFKLQALPSFAASCHKEALREVQSKVAIPGFRKGKVPTKMLERNFPKEVEAEAKEAFYRTALNDAFHLAQIFPDDIQTLKCQELTFSLDAPSQLTASFESEPEVPEIDLASLRLPQVAAKSVTDDDLSKELFNLQMAYAEWEEVSDRPAQENDWISVSSELLEGGQSVQTMWKEEKVQVTSEEMSDWLREALIGMAPGQTKETTTAPAPGATEQERKLFIPRQCRLTLHKIVSPKLPEMTSELFEKLKVESEEDLKEKARKRLEKQNAQKQLEEEKRLSRQHILNEFGNFDLPQSALNQEVEIRKRNHIEFLKSAKYSDELINSKMEDIAQVVAEESAAFLKLFYLARRHAHALKLSFTQEELMRQYALELFYPGLIPLLNQSMDQKQTQDRVVRALCVERLLLFPFQQAAHAA